MEDAVNHLEQSVKKADSLLDDIAWKVDLVEQELCDPQLAYNPDGSRPPVMDLLICVSQVKEDYEHLKREIHEVQELQRVVRDSVHMKALQVQQRMIALRKKIKDCQSDNH